MAYPLLSLPTALLRCAPPEVSPQRREAVFFWLRFMNPNKRSTFKVARDSDKGGIKALQLESLVVGVEGDASKVSGDAARIHRWLVAVKRPVTMREIHKTMGEWRDGRCGGPGWYAVRGFPTEELIDASLAYEQTEEVAD